MKRDGFFVMSDKEYSFLDFALRSKKFTIGSLASEVGVSQGYFSSMLNGKANLGKKHRHKIYETLDNDEKIEFLLYERSFVGGRNIVPKKQDSQEEILDRLFKYVCKGTANIFRHLPPERKQGFLEKQRDFGYEVAAHSNNGDFRYKQILKDNNLGSIDDLMDTAFANLAEEIANVYVTIPAKLKQEIMFKQSDLGHEIDVAGRQYYKEKTA